MDGNTVVIPHEMVEKPGSQLLVGVFGVDAGKNFQISTLWASLSKIRAGTDPSGDLSTNAALPVWEQLQEDVEELKQNSSHISGQEGGYYTPSVVQADERTMMVSFMASKDGMTEVADQRITLPAGEQVLSVLRALRENRVWPE